jgi:hypothetical protein
LEKRLWQLEDLHRPRPSRGSPVEATVTAAVSAFTCKTGATAIVHSMSSSSKKELLERFGHEFEMEVGSHIYAKEI